MTNSPEYEAAIETHNAAAATYRKACKAHLGGQISDTVYFAARAVMVEADKAFDAAFEAEANREPEAAETDDDRQIALAL